MSIKPLFYFSILTKYFNITKSDVMKNITLAPLGLLLLSFFVLPLGAQSKSGKNVAKTEINQLLEDWHKAASEANADAYFSKMAAASVFIGTDAGEHWTKEAFYAFAKPYFDKGKAWDFKTIERNIFVEGKYAWFDELLDTWMGVCRASGLLKKHKKVWKITHYHLSVTVPNERVESFLEIATKPEEVKPQQK